MQRSPQRIFILPVSKCSSRDYLSLIFVSCILMSGREKLPNKEQKAVDGKFNRMYCWVVSQAELEICCLLEVWAMVLVVQQPSAGCTAIFTMCAVRHRPPPSAVIIQENWMDQPWNRYQHSVGIQCAGNTPNTLILANGRELEILW